MPARQPRATNAILNPPDEPTGAELPSSTRDTLALAALTVGAFRWRLRAAGYPFREPPGVDSLSTQIDALLHPEELRRT